MEKKKNVLIKNNYKSKKKKKSVTPFLADFIHLTPGLKKKKNLFYVY